MKLNNNFNLFTYIFNANDIIGGLDGNGNYIIISPIFINGVLYNKNDLIPMHNMICKHTIPEILSYALITDRIILNNIEYYRVIGCFNVYGNYNGQYHSFNSIFNLDLSTKFRFIENNNEIKSNSFPEYVLNYNVKELSTKNTMLIFNSDVLSRISYIELN